MNGSASSSNPRRPTAPAAAAQLAPGFRFHPTDEELVSYYLRRKVAGKSLRIDAIAEIDLYKCEPWDLPPLSRIVSRDLEWYFFSPLDRKYSNRSRMNRSTAQGYWKTTGKDRPVRHHNRVVGMKKTLVYHAGRAPRGERTNWVMHEYRLEDQEFAGTVTCTGIPQDAYVVCRIFKKNGPGPQNGAQYGAPFNEEEWEETDGGMIVLRDDGDDDFYDAAGEQEQEYLQMNDFLQNQYLDNQHANDSDFVPGPNLQDSGSHQEDPSVLLEEEILNDPSFNNDMVEHTDEPGLQNGPVLSNDMGEKISMEDWSYTPPSQNEGYVELNDLAGTVNAEDLPSEDSVGCSLRTCNVDGVDDSINLQEILDVEEFFDIMNENINQPELFQMSPTLCDNYKLQPIDLRNPLAGDFPSDQPAEGNTMFYDAASNDPAFAQDNFAELNHLLDSPISDPSGFDMVDNLMAYFDATDDNLHVHTVGSLEKSGCMNSSIWDQFNLTPEFDGINAQPNEVIPWASEANVASGSSSSLRLPDAGNQLKTENDVNIKLDVQGSESNGKTITKRLVNMLGSISAPPAIAAEYPVRRSEKPVGQISEAHSASSIHVTTGMIQIRGLTMTGSTEHWSLQKNGDVGFLLSYSMAGNEVRKSIGFEPISKMQGGPYLLQMLRGGFCLFFLSVLMLTVSYGVGLCICSR